MKLVELLKNVEYELLAGDANIEIKSLTSDSRKVGPGTAFVAIVGAVSDGHSYIPATLESGVSAIVVQEGASFDLELIKDKACLIQVKNSRLALAYMSQEYFGRPQDEMTIIGITGTKGKTTTTYMIREILEACGHKTGLIGTIETIIGDVHTQSKNTTPESYTLHETFRKMLDAGIKTVVMEVSSQALKLDRTAGIIFDYAIFTNLSPDHIGPNEHESFEEYMECKAMLFRQSKIGIFNADDPYSKKMIEKASCQIQTYGLEHEADFKASNMALYSSKGKIGLTFDCSCIEERLTLNMPGKFSVYNALCAISVAKNLGAPDSMIVKGLADSRVKGRIELVDISDRFSIIIDYAHNAIALKSILETLRDYNPGRIVTIFGCGGNRSRERRFEMGEVSGQLSDFTIITSDNPRFEDPLDIIKDIKVGIEKTSKNYIEIPDRADAVLYAIENAKEGDIIVLAGKGHENYQEIKGVKHHMEEAELIMDAVDKLKAKGINV